MNPTTLSKSLGFFSLALGAGELLFGRKIADAIGSDSPRLVETFGAREVASGIAILSRPSDPTGALSRVGGDVLDAIAVGREALRSDNPKRTNAYIALGIVAGALLIDLYATGRLAKNRTGAR